MTSAQGLRMPQAPGVAQKAGLNRGLANAGFGEIWRQVECKSVMRGRDRSLCRPFRTDFADLFGVWK